MSCCYGQVIIWLSIVSTSSQNFQFQNSFQACAFVLPLFPRYTFGHLWQISERTINDLPSANMFVCMFIHPIGTSSVDGYSSDYNFPYLSSLSLTSYLRKWQVQSTSHCHRLCVTATRKKRTQQFAVLYGCTMELEHRGRGGREFCIWAPWAVLMFSTEYCISVMCFPWIKPGVPQTCGSLNSASP